jgi:hypothetical protein
VSAVVDLIVSVAGLICLVLSYVMALVAVVESCRQQPRWARAAFFMAFAIWLHQ